MPPPQDSPEPADHPRPGPASTRVGRYPRPWPDSSVWFSVVKNADDCPMNSPSAVNALTVAAALPNWSSDGRIIAHSGRRSLMKPHGSGMIRLACRSGSVLHARSGNVNVNPLMIVVKAGADGSRADRESCSQESTTAGGSSQLSSSQLVRCPCHGLHFLHVAESTQQYTHSRCAPCSPAVRVPLGTLPPLSNPTPLPRGCDARAGTCNCKKCARIPPPCRTSCGGLPAFRRLRLWGNETAARRRPVPHAGVVRTLVLRLDLA